LIIDGEIVGYFGEMLQSLAEKIGRENIHIAVENIKEVFPAEYQKYTIGYRSFKPEYLYVGKITELI